MAFLIPGYQDGGRERDAFLVSGNSESPKTAGIQEAVRIRLGNGLLTPQPGPTSRTP